MSEVTEGLFLDVLKTITTVLEVETTTTSTPTEETPTETKTAPSEETQQPDAKSQIISILRQNPLYEDGVYLKLIKFNHSQYRTFFTGEIL